MRSRNLKSVCGMQKNEFLWLCGETEVSICQFKHSETSDGMQPKL